MKRLEITPEGRDALAEARAETDLARDHRLLAAGHARRRCQAVLRANAHGASYRVIADACGVSLGMVQQWMTAARRQDPS